MMRAMQGNTPILAQPLPARYIYGLMKTLLLFVCVLVFSPPAALAQKIKLITPKDLLRTLGTGKTLSPPAALAQKKRGQVKIDSAVAALPALKEDTVKAGLLDDIAFAYRNIDPEKGLDFARQTLELSKRLGWKEGEVLSRLSTGVMYMVQGKNAKALEAYDIAYSAAEKIGDKHSMQRALSYMASVYNDQGDKEKALDLNQRALVLAQQGNDSGASIIANIGSIYMDRLDYATATDYFFRALRIMEQKGDKENAANVLGNIALIFEKQEDLAQATEYRQKAVKLNKETGNKRGLAKSLMGLAGLKFRRQDYRGAVEEDTKALRLYEELGDKRQIAEALGSIAVSKSWIPEYDEARALFRQKMVIDLELNNREGAAYDLSCFGTIFIDQATDTALSLPAARRLALADSAIYYLGMVADSFLVLGKIRMHQKSLEDLSKAYAYKGDYARALAIFKKYSASRDSSFILAKKNDITRKEMSYVFGKKQDSLRLEGEKKALSLQKEAQLAALRYEYQKKQAAAKSAAERAQLAMEEEYKRNQIADEYRYSAAAVELRHQREEATAKAAHERRELLAAAEVKRQKNRAAAAGVAGVLLLIIALIAIVAYRNKQRLAAVITREKKRSDDLLLNILPAEVAEELKDGGASAARQYDQVSVLFTDFVDFTGTAQNLSPQALVQELHECFSAFDAIIERNGLEKIKTIGDAYMAVCGLPVADERHAQRAVQAALEIRDFIAERGKRERVFQIRIGIHSGPVVAGIVGVKKFAYDIWGDTVNTANRMESSGEAGKVNISEATYALVKNVFQCTPRGKIAAKGKGEVEMYFVAQK